VENEKKEEKKRKTKKTKESGRISEFRKGVRENEHRITESQKEEKKTTKINRLEHTQRTTNSF
jgi:hypothetical protein